MANGRIVGQGNALGYRWLAPVCFGLMFAVYVAGFFAVVETELSGDGPRYVEQAINLTNGYFVSPDRLWIANGPGYPLLLSIFVAAEADWFWARLLNPVFIVSAFLFLYLTLCLYLPRRHALFGVLGVACYYPFLLDLGRLMTESLSHMLIALWAYLICLLWKHRKPSLAIATGVVFGYLCLTKVVFGYLLVIALLSIGTWAAVSRSRQLVMLASSFVIAMLVCIPYLAYTNSVTGKVFHWADIGAYNLYWMSSPYPGDSGGWHTYSSVAKLDELAPHRPFLDRLQRTPYQDRSQLLTEKAVEHIKANPVKYFKNWLANVGRTVFNYPIDYATQTLRTYFYIVANSVILYFLIRSVGLVWQHRPKLPPELLLLMASALIVYGGTTLVFANPRIVRPLLFLVFPLMIVILMRMSRSQLQKADVSLPEG